MDTWLTAAHTALAEHEPAVLVSIIEHPPLLPVPLGPVCLVTRQRVVGALHLGAARAPALDACAQALTAAPGTLQTLAFTLNPWAGGPTGHSVQVQLRTLAAADADAIANALQVLVGGCELTMTLDAAALAVTPGARLDALPLSHQAAGVDAGTARFSAPDDTVLVLGAGVLAHRVVECLADTPVRVAWASLGDAPSLAAWPANAVALGGQVVPGHSALPQPCHALVMTHDHDLDIDLCHRLLSQGQVTSIGMVGSQSKRAHLERTLAARGVAAEAVAHIRCPLGGGNHRNLEHASVAIAAELLDLR
ncbi:MAG: XdhC family protein [Pseudomonadota bacterium]